MEHAAEFKRVKNNWENPRHNLAIKRSVARTGEDGITKAVSTWVMKNPKRPQGEQVETGQREMLRARIVK
jgi:hypothetical protein